MRCGRADVEAKRCGALELWMCVAGVGTWRYGGRGVRCRRADVEVLVMGADAR